MQEAMLEEGATLFLYTDGVTEAKNEARQLFGLERTEAVLQRCAAAQLGPKEILEAMGDEVHRFVGSAEQSDDLTMLAIRYSGKK
jgi:sigma-B regulation protein RsbU (phosphoserine phosphatase)